MAQTRRSRVPADPADVYRMHAAEARSAKATARSDDGATHFDHAAGYHDTAARMISNVAKNKARAVAYRQAAAAARGRRREDVAVQYDALADAQDQAAAFAPQRADRFHMMGLERSAAGREHEAKHPTDEALVDAAAARARVGEARVASAEDDDDTHRYTETADEPAASA
jgi:hypothetical protein